MGVSNRIDAPTGRHALSIESQLLAIGSGFVVFVALVAIFAAIQQRKRRRNSGRDFHSPLIQSFNSNKQRFRATSRNFGSSSSNGGSPPPMLSPSSDSSSSPQCTPMTPYASFASHAELPIQKQNAENGSLSLAINYDKEAKSLQITVISCHNLPELQMSNNSKSALNPYVKMRVLPDNQHRIKTRVLRNTNNPFFDEQFTIYGVSYEQLKTYTLHLAALASDRFSRDTVLGEAFLNLAEVERRRDFNDNENKDNTIELKLYPRPVYADLQAQIFLSIAYNQLTNSINFAVLKMKDLPCSEQIGQIDAYVKVYMLLNGNRISKHKSHVKRRTNDPVFNESFCFNLPSMVNDGSRFHSPDQILDNISFEVQVLNHNGVTRSEIIGSCMVGGSTSRHWQAVREQPGQQIAEWHRIQS
ncbi:hypothetical protein M3Y97_00431100 [Aphelenchoides bicaudatus]|nr:hypothetical protein M3Y97_00431100 [Aphelenchoides bicaudatus]